MESLVEKSYFEIIRSQQSWSVRIIAIKSFFNGDDVLLIEFGWDVESGIELFLANGNCGVTWAPVSASAGFIAFEVLDGTDSRLHRYDANLNINQS